MRQIFQEYTANTPAKIILTTPSGKTVQFDMQERRDSPYFGLFVANLEVGYCLTTIAHVHFVNDPTRLSGYFEAEMTFGSGEEATTERCSQFTLEQICEIIDRDDWEFCLDLFTNRGPYNRNYWPESTLS